MIDPTISSAGPDALTSAGESGVADTTQVNAYAAAIVLEKLGDADGTTYAPEFSPEEADIAGAFVEDALSEENAREAGSDSYQVRHSVNPATP